jgi:hypothetical protein
VLLDLLDLLDLLELLVLLDLLDLLDLLVLLDLLDLLELLDSLDLLDLLDLLELKLNPLGYVKYGLNDFIFEKSYAFVICCFKKTPINKEYDVCSDHFKILIRPVHNGILSLYKHICTIELLIVVGGCNLHTILSLYINDIGKSSKIKGVI